MSLCNKDKTRAFESTTSETGACATEYLCPSRHMGLSVSRMPLTGRFPRAQKQRQLWQRRITPCLTLEMIPQLSASLISLLPSKISAYFWQLQFPSADKAMCNLWGEEEAAEPPAWTGSSADAAARVGASRRGPGKKPKCNPQVPAHSHILLGSC